jgi:hypothetical protein
MPEQHVAPVAHDAPVVPHAAPPMDASELPMIVPPPPLPPTPVPPAGAVDPPQPSNRRQAQLQNKVRRNIFALLGVALKAADTVRRSRSCKAGTSIAATQREPRRRTSGECGSRLYRPEKRPQLAAFADDKARKHETASDCAGFR